MKVKEWFKRRLRELQIGDPNSPEGLRERAKRLVQKGCEEDNPMVTALLKQADIKEGKHIPHHADGSPLTPKEYIELLKSKGFHFEED